ncbi:MAG: DNA polymerase I [Gammaproteobacteria bacterium]|nr:MAG: DNA polymerase I [Gammaproteobacteria bacterium]|tara:strand:+ start:964 stop:3648 length:2685 start_codon:yes stop_codon:yes gene_type:complete
MAKPESTADTDSVILIDGSSYVYRAYHALPPLTTSSGHPTGAVRGVTTMVMRILEDHPNSPIGMIFDAKGDTFRHEMYEEYKANRPPMPDDLRPQIQPIYDIVEALGIKIFVVDNVEADDVIGTLAKEAEEKGIPTVISTGDKDLAQLVTKNIKLVNTMTNEVLDQKGVEKKFGVLPNQIIDYLALVGDTSDNIPGVNKVGPKTAVNWLSKYGTVESIIEKSDEISGKVGEYLREGIEQLKLSQQLTTIKKDVALDFGIEDLAVNDINQDKLHKLFSEFEFKTLLKNTEAKKTPVTKENYRCVLTEKELNDLVKELKTAEFLAFDTETDSLDFTQANLVGLSLAANEEKSYYIPVGHDYDGAPKQLDLEVVLKKLKPIIESTPLIGQHLKFDRNVLSNYDITINEIENDTMLMSYVFDPTATRHNLDAMAGHYLNVKTTTFEDVAGKGVKQLTFNQIPLEKASDYAAEDADITFRCYAHLKPKLAKTPSLEKVLSEIEIPLVPVLSDMEQAGALVDKDSLKIQSNNLGQRISGLEEQAYREAGKEFNLASTKDLRAIFFDEMELPVVKKTPGGQPSTDESVLQELANQYELPKILLEHRTLAKLKSTYTDSLPQQISAKTGRVHTSFHQAVTSTGRLSSADPNLQNIPIKTDEGRLIRTAFVAPKGYQLLAVDYSQIELRIMAHLSEDNGLISAFENGEDIHSVTAAEVFAEPGEEVTAEQRRGAKAINFGLIYGMSAFGLSKALNISRPVAADYIDSYFHKYPGVKLYMERTKELAKEKGFVETFFGRRLYLPGIHSGRSRMAAERAAINAPMQGTAADIMKIAMIDIHKWLASSRFDARMIMQVHDEVILEVKDQDTAEVEKKVSQIMQDAAKLRVPLEVESGIAKNWGEAH